jgi:hypothetical protein
VKDKRESIVTGKRERAKSQKPAYRASRKLYSLPLRRFLRSGSMALPTMLGGALRLYTA